MSTAVSRQLVQNNESEERAAEDTSAIYRRAERNVYVFLAAMIVVVVLTSIYLFDYNRRMFNHVEQLSHPRSELAQQLISTQENTFRSLSRELHDDFGQILTAIGAMLARAQRRTPAEAGVDKQDLHEIQEVTQSHARKGALAFPIAAPRDSRRRGVRGRDRRLPAALREANRGGSAIRQDRDQPRVGPRRRRPIFIACCRRR